MLLGDLASLEQLIDSRIAIEPAPARLAAAHGTRADVERISDCAVRCRCSEDWRSY
jgi:DNA-binding FadR family transcriptional regulator